MDDNQKRYLHSIARAALADKLVVLVGAGVSMNSGFPSWEQLATSSKHLLPSRPKQDIVEIKKDLLNYFEQFQILDKKHELKDSIKKEFAKVGNNTNYIHDLIFGLQPRVILTTNYDDLLEEYDNSHARIYNTIRTNYNIRDKTGARLIVKMHGDFHTNRIVITKTDYEKYHSSDDYRLILNTVSTSIADNILLLIGFSGKDPNVNAILTNIKNALTEDAASVFLLSADFDEDFSTVSNQTFHIIQPITPEDIKEITDDENSKVNHASKKNTITNPKGKNITDTLFYIQHAVKVEDEESKIDQLILQMSFYKDINFLFEHHFERVLEYVGIQPHTYYNVWTVSDKLFEQIINIKESDWGRYKDFIWSLHSFEIEKIVARESNRFIETTEELKDEVIGDENDTYYTKTVTKFFEYASTFDYNTILMEVENISITLKKNEQDVRLAILCSQFRQMLGQHKEALYLLLEYEECSKEKSSLWEYVLLQLNLRSIFRAIYGNSIGYKEIKFDELLRIKDKIESFNIGRLIDLPPCKYPSHFQYFVIDTFNKSAIYRNWSELKEATEDIEEDYDNLVEGNISGHSIKTIDLLNYRFEQYGNFTNGNHLPASFWWQEKIVVEEYIKGVLIRYTTDNNLRPLNHYQHDAFFPPELTELTYEILIRLTASSSYKLLDKLIKQYKISNCKADNVALEKYVKAFDNLINFTCEHNNRWKMLNAHQYYIFNFYIIFSIMPSAISKELWKNILDSTVKLIKECILNNKFLYPFNLFVESVPIEIIPEIRTELDGLYENLLRNMVFIPNGELFLSAEAGSLLITIFKRIADEDKSFFTSTAFQNIISDVIDRWVSEASNINTPRFINNILFYSYYFVSESLQQKIKDFTLSRFTVENIDSLIKTCYLFSINKTIEFSTEIHNSILNSINKMLKIEGENLPYGYFKEDLRKYLNELSRIDSTTT